MRMYKGQSRGYSILTAAIVLAALMAAGTAYAVTPEQFKSALEENMEDYSDAKTWRNVAGKMGICDARVAADGDDFYIQAASGDDFFTTGCTNVTISGSTADGDIVRLNVRVVPADDNSREYEYQAFSLSEITFESLLGGSTDSDMSSYLFLYDVYPYAMWASDSVLGDNERSLNTALGGTKYAIYARSAKADSSVSFTMDVLGAASEDDNNAARENLYANYAFESICSLVSELNTCADTCKSMLAAEDMEDISSEMVGDMSACAEEYYALSADWYAKLTRLTQQLNPLFIEMESTLKEMSNGLNALQVETLDDTVEKMQATLRTMY